MNPEEAAKLREPFPDSMIGHLPRAGTTLSYVGHAAVTDRLLAVDADWTWEPVAFATTGAPLWTIDSGNAVMWIRLTVAGVTRLGVGICKDNAVELEKQLISDALRNAAMRFGVGLDLWSKEDLSATEPQPVAAPKAEVDRLVVAVKAADLGDWVKEQHITWPWTPDACEQIRTKLSEPF